jgi:hypothetical protein
MGRALVLLALCAGCADNTPGTGGGAIADLGDLPVGGNDLSASMADLAGGADLTSAPPDLAPPADLWQGPGVNTTVTLFDNTEFCFNCGNPQQNRRDVDSAPVNLPSTGLYSQITLHIELGCRNGNQCDPWDRRASIGINDNGHVVEIARFMTTYGVPGAWDVDVTDLRPLLSGTRTAHGFIDTWIGDPQGWTVTAKLSYVGGIPAKVPVAVVPLAWGDFDYGNPNNPISKSLPAQQATLPPGTSSAALRVTITGHGQGNTDNCAEFCQKNHTVLVNGSSVAQKMIWKPDCDQNPINNQGGNWQSPRTGWCPGEAVTPWTVDLGAHSAPFMIAYNVQDYSNTCSDVNNFAICNPNDCTICNPGECGTQKACSYNNNGHTSPFWNFSAILIEYE